MERIPTTQLAAYVGEQVRLAGWLHRFRQFGSIGFLIVRDGLGLAQVIVDNPTLIAQLAAIPSESVLAIEGEAVTAEQAPGVIEVRASRVEVIAAASAPPPFDLFRPTLPAQRPTILDHAPVALRHPRHRALFRLQATSVKGFRTTLDSLGFVEVHTPKIVASATESGANVFTIDYFGRPAYLAQSPQFYKQIMVGVFERVYEVGPVFRAEPHDTPRHLNEYVSLDVEMGFIMDHRTIMGVLTDVLRGMLQALEEEARTVKFLDVRLPEVPERIPEIHFSDAMALISEGSGEDVRAEVDLAPAHERWLGDWSEREYHSDFLFVTGYPMRKRPFYTHPDPASPAYSNSFDLIFRGLELVTGGQRLHRYTDYLSALEARGQDPAPLEGYLEAFKHGMPPHGGFALGLERWIAQLTGASNVRETTLFPRDLNRIKP